MYLHSQVVVAIGCYC